MEQEKTLDENPSSLQGELLVGSLPQYQKHYSEEGLADKLRSVAKAAGAGVIYPALLLYGLFKSPSVPLRDKAIIVGALGYFILPLDLLPDTLPAIGFADDTAALMAALKAMAPNISPQLRRQARAGLRKHLGAFNEKALDAIDSAIGIAGGRTAV